MDEEEWTPVLITGDLIEAEMVKDLLESGGITVVMRSSRVGPFPVNVGKMGEIKLLVRISDKEAAERVIREEHGTEDR